MVCYLKFSSKHMPNFQVTIVLNGHESVTARGAAEGAWMYLLTAMLHGQCLMEVKNVETGDTETIQLEEDLDNDQSLLRYMGLVMLASKFLSKEKRDELIEWERDNIDGQYAATTDWPGWEDLIGKKPKKFRYDMGLELLAGTALHIAPAI